MSTTKAKYHIRTKQIIDHYLQADWYLHIIPTDAQSVEIHMPSQEISMEGMPLYQPMFPKKTALTVQDLKHITSHQIQADEIYDSADNYPTAVSSSEDSCCLQVKIKQQQDGVQKVPRPTHLITNIAYQLKQYHNRNKYLRARIDTCADMNLMPVSV